MDENTALHFDRLSGYISDALEYADGTHTLDDVRALLDEGSLQLWPGAASAVVTQLIQTPRQKLLHFFLVGGNMDELKRLYPIILDWGRANGCTRATLSGRKGWERTFLTREEGWTTPLVCMQKELTHG